MALQRRHATSEKRGMLNIAAAAAADARSTC